MAKQIICLLSHRLNSSISNCLSLAVHVTYIRYWWCHYSCTCYIYYVLCLWANPALKKICLLLSTVYKPFETTQLPLLSSITDGLSFMQRLCKFSMSKRQACPYCTIEHLVLIFVLYIEVYVIYKPWCKYEPKQNHRLHVVIPWLRMSKTLSNKARYSTKLHAMLITAAANFSSLGCY